MAEKRMMLDEDVLKEELKGTKGPSFSLSRAAEDIVKSFAKAIPALQGKKSEALEYKEMGEQEKKVLDQLKKQYPNLSDKDLQDMVKIVMKTFVKPEPKKIPPTVLTEKGPAAGPGPKSGKKEEKTEVPKSLMDEIEDLLKKMKGPHPVMRSRAAQEPQRGIER